ncbi:MAG: 5-(carboxyamino)imidazole ribonucleotide synthase [Burkholderiaceae bacterium]|nr:5-(carboxyamino)imidazole ribonucleotide synthase [Burkholderiaceae bacterium]MCD8516597.1 5-(carboxyamino)imidazole ribonucleotide synthase [Burkholderiaceae bacterium]MCD8537310.1 5-(carboxyamino)imidazole ribonucleotide synthase [Burkholderiaceae bacterium]MCD8565180.1 5-(carboxyamino)imidazole ribonucleotide synthase [Burkholderiaceae bacterium]
MIVKPGQWLGVLGAGQLGRMFCQSAQAMGYRVLVLDPDEVSPTADLADDHIVAAYDDVQALGEMAKRCLAVTTEFENVPARSLELLSRRTHVMPGASAVGPAQDRCLEKRFIESMGVRVAPYADIRTEADIEAASESLFPGILKVARLGYDGKGQWRVASKQEALAAFNEARQVPCVLEARLDLAYELSVVLARDTEGKQVFYPVSRNIHHEGILAVTHVDGLVTDASRKATQAASQIAEGLGYHGVLCVEFFVLKDGSLIANEMAPRPHNSGHYTQNACVASQFEQQARVMAGLPLGDTRLLSPAVMLNLLGDVWLSGASADPVEPDWSAVLAKRGVSLHLYGKREARIGRKMGHINITSETFEQAVSVANEIVELLQLPVRAVATQ